MGYESKVYIISKRKDSDFGEVIAMFDCCCMKHGFTDLFRTPINFTCYQYDGNTKIEKDGYGEICKYTDIHEVIQWLKHEIEYEKESTCAIYRRLKPLYELLKAFDNNDWMGVYNNVFEMLVLHYGY